MPDVTLAIIEGREAGREFLVTRTTVIGRDPGADRPEQGKGLRTDDLGGPKGAIAQVSRPSGHLHGVARDDGALE